MALTKATYSMINGAPLNVLDYGAVADGTSGGGTDNLAAFEAAIADAHDNGIDTVIVPAGNYYLSDTLTLTRGVTLVGFGTSFLPVWNSGSNQTGTVLLINAPTSGDGIVFDSTTAAAKSGIKDMSIYHVGSTTNRSVVFIENHLYPQLINVEIASLVISQGVGLYLIGSTLWGNYSNVICAIDDIGGASESSFRLGLYVYGISNTEVANANSFVSCQFGGTYSAAKFDGNAGDTGASACAFVDCRFDLVYKTGTPVIYIAGASYLYDFGTSNCYICKVVEINKGKNLSFHGCYFESAGQPATYNDGTHGSLNLAPVFYNNDATYTIGTGVVDGNWNSVYIYDNASKTTVTPTTAGYNHSTRLIPELVNRQTVAQTITTSVWTNVDFDGVVFGDSSHLAWDATGKQVTIKKSGAYLVTATVQWTPWYGAGEFVKIRVNTDAGYTFEGQKIESNATGMTLQISQIINLTATQHVFIQVIQSAATSKTLQINDTVLSVVQLT